MNTKSGMGVDVKEELKKLKESGEIWIKSLRISVIMKRILEVD
jgi:hypothetical protein